MSYIKNVPSVNGSNLKETIDQIDKNFRTLCNDGVFKGDPGEGYMSKTLQLWSVDDGVITIHNEDVLKTIFGDNVWEKVKGWSVEDFEMLDIPKEWTLYPGNPLWYVQNPSAYNLFLSMIGEGADYSCMVAVDGGFSDGNYIYKRYDIVPQLYREESTGNYCWKINGVKTGISASNNPDINGVRNVRFYLIKNTGTDDAPSYLYLTSVDGAVEWRDKADIDPVVGDFAWELSRETVSVSGVDQTVSVLKVCMYNGYKWSQATADPSNKNYFLSYDDAMMAYVWGEVYGGLGDAYSESIAPVENHSFCFRTKDKDGNDVDMTHMISSKYNDIVKETNPGSDLVIKAPIGDDDGQYNLVIDGYDGIYTSSVGTDGLPPADSKVIIQRDLDEVQDELNKKIDNHAFKKVTWSALKSLRGGNNLIPGTRYCITDYVCGAQCYDAGTVYENEKSFYIITTALGPNTLDENVRVAEKNPDSPVFPYNDLSKWEVKYSIDQQSDKYDWVTTSIRNDIYGSRMSDLYERCVKITLKNTGISICGKCKYTVIGSERGGIYYLYKLDDLTKAKLIDMIATENLSGACDLIPIAIYLSPVGTWAKDLTDYELVYINSSNVPVTISIVENNIMVNFRDYDTRTNQNNSHGVIYYMKDDRGLSAPYDFKNILFADRNTAFDPIYPESASSGCPYTFNQWEYIYDGSGGITPYSTETSLQSDISQYVGMINCSVGESYISTRDVYGSYKRVGYTLGHNRMRAALCAAPRASITENDAIIRSTFHDNHIENGCSNCLITSNPVEAIHYRLKSEPVDIELYDNIIHGSCKDCAIISSNNMVFESGCDNCKVMLCENTTVSGSNICTKDFTNPGMSGKVISFRNCIVLGNFLGKDDITTIHTGSGYFFRDYNTTISGRILTIGSRGYVTLENEGSDEDRTIVGKSYLDIITS